MRMSNTGPLSHLVPYLNQAKLMKSDMILLNETGNLGCEATINPDVQSYVIHAFKSVSCPVNIQGLDSYLLNSIKSMPVLIQTKDLAALCKILKERPQEIVEFNYYYANNAYDPIDARIYIDGECAVNVPLFNPNAFITKWEALGPTINMCPYAIIDNLQDIEDFRRIMAYKAEDGGRMCNLNSMIVYIIKSLISLKKNESIRFTGYNESDETLLVCFTVFQKSGIVVNTYYRILKVI